MDVAILKVVLEGDDRGAAEALSRTSRRIDEVAHKGQGLGKLGEGLRELGRGAEGIGRELRGSLGPALLPSARWKGEVREAVRALGLEVASEFRRAGTRTVTGGVSQHAYGSPYGALDIVGPRRQLEALFDWVRTNYAGKIHELFYTPKGLIKEDTFLESARVAASHWDHLHVSLRGARGLIERLPEGLRRLSEQERRVQEGVQRARRRIFEARDPVNSAHARALGMELSLYKQMPAWIQAYAKSRHEAREQERRDFDRRRREPRADVALGPLAGNLRSAQGPFLLQGAPSAALGAARAVGAALQAVLATRREANAEIERHLRGSAEELALSRLQTEEERARYEVERGRYALADERSKERYVLDAKQRDEEARKSRDRQARARLEELGTPEAVRQNPGWFGANVISFLAQKRREEELQARLASLTHELRDHRSGLLLGLDGLTGRYDRFEEAARRAGVAVGRLTDEQRRLLQEGERLEHLRDYVQGVAQGLRRAWEGFFADVRERGMQSFGGLFAGIRDAFLLTLQRMLHDLLASRLTQLTVETLIGLGIRIPTGKRSAGTSGGGQPAPARAKGGPTRAGAPYLVGEEGPELFVPGASGFVLPHAVTRSLLEMSTRGPGIAAEGARAGGGRASAWIERPAAAGGGGKSVVVHAPVTVVAPNPGAYRNSEAQMAGRLGERIRRAMERDG